MTKGVMLRSNLDVSDKKEPDLKNAAGSQLHENEQWFVTLKDDTHVDARDACSALRRLQRVLSDRPASVQELYAFAKGDRESLSSDVKQLFFAHTDFLGTVISVLLNGAVVEQETIKAVGDPFQPTTENKQILEAVADDGNAIWNDFLARGGESNDPDL